MAFNDFINKLTGKPPDKKAEEKPKPPEQKPAQQKPTAKPEGPSAAERQTQAAKDRSNSPGPFERYLKKNPEVLQKALDAKAEREKPKPTKHDHVPPSQPKPGPMIQTPAGLVQMPATSVQPKPPPRKPTNADRMLDRAKNASPPKPPIKSFRENHPESGRNRTR